MTRFKTWRPFAGWAAIAAILWVGFAVPDGLVAQENPGLSYISSDADIVMVSRPAKILKGNEYQKLKRLGGSGLDKMIERMTDSYFKFSFTEIDNIDQIVYATSIPDRSNPGGVMEMYSVFVLKTTKDNSTGFDMVTQDVKEIYNYLGEEFFEFKRPINYVYRFAYIGDSRTIVWGTSKTSIEKSIDARTQGPKLAGWYNQWREFSSKQFSLAMGERALMSVPLPGDLSGFKKIKVAAGGADLNQQMVVRAKGLCHDATDARKVVESIEAGLEMAQQALESAKKNMRRQGQESQYVLMKDLVEAAKVKSSGKSVEVTAKFEIDLKSVVDSLESTSKAARRTQAANNLRQVALAIHNYHDAHRGLPASVLVHESGKKYSWRIAILPFIEQQELYDQYDFTQEWNSPHNREVTSRMPDFFRSDVGDSNSTNTSWFMLTGKEGLGDGESSIRFRDVKDGLSNTILAVEAKRSVHWAKPEDIQVDPDRGLPKFGGFHEGGFNIAMGDGSVRFVDENVDRQALWGMYTASGGEVVGSAILNSKPEDDEKDR